MAEIVLFHHVQGLTSGIEAFADRLREARHTVHTPDLFEGRTFDSIEEGLAFVREIGIDEVEQRGVHAVEAMTHELVYGGFSMGVVPAQKLAQTRKGARGALLFHACVPIIAFGGRWPKKGVPVQVHTKKSDPIFVDCGDMDAAQELIEKAEDAELFLYPGDEHLFTDASLPSYDGKATALLIERVLRFLEEL